MTHVMSFSSRHDKIPNRFSASAPELSLGPPSDDTEILPNLQSPSVSQLEQTHSRPPLIFVSTPSEMGASLLDGDISSRVDRRLLTTSQSGSHSSPTTPIMDPGSNIVTSTDSLQPQPSAQLERDSVVPATTMEEVLIIGEDLGNRIDELRRSITRRQRRAGGITLRGSWNAWRGFFGYGPEGTGARKELVSLVMKLGFGLTQISVVIVVLVLGAVQKSPVDRTVNEWQACHRPLGIWSAVWCIRVLLGCFVAIWMYRHRSSRIIHLQNQRSNTMNADGVAGNNQQHAPIPSNHNDNAQNNIDANTNINSSSTPLQHRDNSPIARLGSVLSLASAIWFIVAHAFLYTSTTTCRLSAPHLWWLTFAIVCIGYIVIVELAIVIILIFIIGPLLMLTINLILICLGREPLQLTSSQPKVGKLSIKAVDTIPLVLYIPAPIDKDPTSPKTENDTSISKPEAAHVHSYPPQRDCPSPSSTQLSGTRVHSRRSKRWFTFRRVLSKKDSNKTSEKQPGSDDPYEDKWEKGEYPFVKLEENRAVCAICLCDFDEPRRVRYSIGSMPPLDLEEKAIGDGGAVESPTSGTESDALRLADAGGGAQPLRLLDCAHVFHKTCVDPWLTEVSGRCPVCQRPVEAKEATKKKQRQT